MRIVRAHARPPEALRLSLVRCDGRPNLQALDALSLLARPKGVDKPSRAARRRFRRTASPRERARLVAPGIARLHPGLLTRLQALAERWPGRSIEIVSGYRPRARRTSRHRHGRALDVRVEGVPRRVVARFARTLPETGVGYYPNSTFTHLDVRQRSVFWVDRSGPGERPDYGPWPPNDEEVHRVRQEVVAEARRLGAELKAALAAGNLGPTAEGAGTADVSPGERRPEADEGPHGVARASSSRAGADAEEPRGGPRSGSPPAPRLDPLPRHEPSWEGGIRAVEGALAAWSELPDEP